MLHASSGGAVFVNERIIKESQELESERREERRAKRRDKQEDILIYAARSPPN